MCFLAIMRLTLDTQYSTHSNCDCIELRKSCTRLRCFFRLFFCCVCNSIHLTNIADVSFQCMLCAILSTVLLLFLFCCFYFGARAELINTNDGVSRRHIGIERQHSVCQKHLRSLFVDFMHPI